MHSSLGVLKYSENPLKLILEVDQGISDYYRSIIPKHIGIKPQRYPAHITIVRNEPPKNMNFWRFHEGLEIPFYYDHFVYNDETYYWLHVVCDRLEKIRLELGLPNSSLYTRPPGRSDQLFHCTIGNLKSN